MIIEEKNRNIIADNQIEATLSINDLPHLMNLLGKNIYVHKYSFINELAQNMTDTTKMAKSKGKDCKNAYVYLEDGFVCFQDYGEGMSVEQVHKYLFQYGSSTKREDNLTVGAKGIGAFSILKFANQAIYSTVQNGVKYEFILLDDSTPKFVPINTSETEEENGTLVKIPYKESDSYILKEELIKRLLYYSEVNCSLINKPLYKNDLFVYSPQNKNMFMHINYFGYIYNIDFSLLGIDPIKIPIAININKLRVTASRESIEYDTEIINLIKEKINDCLEYISNTIDLEFTDIPKYIDFRHKNDVNYRNLFNLNTKYLTTKSNAVYKPLERLKNKPFIKWEHINHNKLNNNFYYKLKNVTDESELQFIDIYIVDSVLSTRNKDFLKKQYTIDNEFITLENFKTFLGLKYYPKEEWRSLISYYIDWFKSKFNVYKTSELKNNEDYKHYLQKYKRTYTKKSTEKFTKVYKISKNEVKTTLIPQSELGSRVIKANKEVSYNNIKYILNFIGDCTIVHSKIDETDIYIKEFMERNVNNFIKLEFMDSQNAYYLLQKNFEEIIEDTRYKKLCEFKDYIYTDFVHLSNAKTHLRFIKNYYPELLENEVTNNIKKFEQDNKDLLILANFLYNSPYPLFQTIDSIKKIYNLLKK